MEITVDWKKEYMSDNLIYHTYDPTEHMRFFNAQYDHPRVLEYSTSICPSWDWKSGSKMAKSIRKSSLLFVMLDDTNKYGLFGCLFLKSSSPGTAQRQCPELGIIIDEDIVREADGLEPFYDTEAIEWALNWAFKSADLHRAEVNIPEWNKHLVQACTNAGFAVEGKKRKRLLKSGKWWDEVNMGVIKEEWESRAIEN
jgi:hypothetical protein